MPLESGQQVSFGCCQANEKRSAADETRQRQPKRRSLDVLDEHLTGLAVQAVLYDVSLT